MKFIRNKIRQKMIMPLKKFVRRQVQEITKKIVLALPPEVKNSLGILKEIRGQAIFNKHTNIKISHQLHKRPYRTGDKIRIVFLFQAASFWPSWQSVWEACEDDDQIDNIMLVCDDPIKEKVQFATAREFLAKKEIEFKHISEVNLEEVQPHVVVLHTPYDSHRPKYLYAPRLTANGYRIVYIPYGIEISDSNKARSDHFHNNVTTSAWKVYTFSKQMIEDYKLHSPTGGDMVRALGHPRFDSLYKLGQKSSMPSDISELAQGRKVVLWKVHFPKKINGKMITPEISEYYSFARKISEFPDLFFIFMPHPKFYEQLHNLTKKNMFSKIFKYTPNICEYYGDEYHEVLMNCDYYIVDRSAVMVEVGCSGKPVLYVGNGNDPEQMTKPVKHIVDSYYQATTAKGIFEYLNEVVLKGNDSKKAERMECFNKVIPSLDGLNGIRIKDDMVKSIKSEVDAK